MARVPDYGGGGLLPLEGVGTSANVLAVVGNRYASWTSPPQTAQQLAIIGAKIG